MSVTGFVLPGRRACRPLAGCLVAVAVLVVACGDDGPNASSASGTTIASTDGASTSTTIDNTAIASTVDGDTALSTGAPRAAACTPEAILPVLDRDLPRVPELHLIGVDVVGCRNGFARVGAVPDQSNCPDNNRCWETEHVFLRDVAGEWEIIGSGTGLTCFDADLSTDVLAACQALAS
jgi:hypothetical protein